MSFNTEKDNNGDDVSDITFSSVSLNNPSDDTKIKYDSATSSWVPVTATTADTTFWSFTGGSPAEPYSSYTGLSSLSSFAYPSGYMLNYVSGSSIGSLGASALVSTSIGWYTRITFPNITAGDYLIEAQISHDLGRGTNAIFRMYLGGSTGITSGYISNKVQIAGRNLHTSCTMRGKAYLNSSAYISFIMVDSSAHSYDGLPSAAELKQTYVKVTQI